MSDAGRPPAGGKPPAGRPLTRPIRHDVEVSAIVSGATIPVLQCAIRDMGRTGLYLAFDDPRFAPPRASLGPGTEVDVVFSARIAGLTRRVEVHGTVVRRAEDGFAVRLAAVEDDAIVVMRAIAAQAISQRYEQPVTVTEMADAPASVASGAVMREVRVILARHLRTLLPVFLNDVAKALFEAASQAVTPAEQRRADVASRGFDRARDNIVRTLERQMLRACTELAGADSTQELAAAPELNSAPTGLVDSLDLGEMLALEHVTEKVEKDLHLHSHELEQRLATLLGRPLNRDSNPLATFNVCRTLCDGVLGRGSGPLIRRALSVALGRQLVEELKRLYIELNACLKRAGVQPTFKQQSGLHKRGADDD